MDKYKLSSVKRTPQEAVMFLVSGLSVIGILPFAVLRLIRHETMLMLLDFGLMIGITALAVYLYRSRAIRLVSIVNTVFYSVGMVLVVYTRGESLVYWAFPVMIATFFLLKPHEAALSNSVTMLALVYALIQHVTPLNFATITVTLLIVNLYSYLFAVRTQQQHDSLSQQASKDFLTGAGNRLALEAQLAAAVSGFQKSRVVASLVLLDIDHFKTVNDSYGHVFGDAVLVRLSEIVRARIRNSDAFFRYGGEEFVVIAMGSSLDATVKLAEELRQRVQAAKLVPAQELTVSLGVAELREGQSSADWLARADSALYDAKRSGRNMTRVAP
ncbi:GGDEF domain-containing protein [Roseateles sp.]|uniref:GGDEF domain-containing protein n=1 Tax=Roseateles sp. TaxID=1971397 RepID=UPI00286CF985|nr:GGDEF domain-containing protein [Roseateles sp.]